MEDQTEVKPTAGTRQALRKVWRRTSRGHKRAVILLVLGGAVLRAMLLTAPITYDEAFAYNHFVTSPAMEVIGDYSHPGNQVLHTLLVKLSVGLFGPGLWQIRSPAFLAGVAALPLIYLFARAMFNRYIALMALALCAASGPLIEQSALSRGLSLTWVFFLLALLFGRQLAKNDRTLSAVLLALTLALGFWTIPIMVYPMGTIYVWLVLYITTRYDTTMSRRLGRVLLSVVLLMVFCFALYSPAIFTHGVARLFYHPSMGDNSWQAFKETQSAASIDLWIWISETSAIWVCFVGIMALLFAVYVSSKYRMLLLAMVLACVPLVLLHRIVGPPQNWAWILYLFHLGSAIALFYLLKQLQDRLWPGLTKRLRTAVAGGLLFIAFAWRAVPVVPRLVERFGDAQPVAHHLSRTTGARDRVLAEYPWAEPLAFYLAMDGADAAMMERDPRPPCQLQIVVCPGDGQSPQSVLLHNKQPGEHASIAAKVKEWEKLELFQARLED